MARPRKYTLNENYFDIIDSVNKAYILGFIYADGSINKAKGNLTICLSKKDIEVLEFIKQEVNYSGVISTKVINNMSYSLLSITSKRLINKIIELGVVQNKTYLSTNLPDIPQEYFNDMLRGFFDGDGSIYGDSNKGYTICFSSNISILELIKQYLLSLKIKSSKIRLRNQDSINSAMLEIRGNKQIEKLISLLFNNEYDFSLNRKKSKFLEFKEYLQTLTRRNVSDEVIIKIKNLFKEEKTQKEIHELLGLPYSSVRTIIQRLRKNKEI
jgi:intein-encoded DNA endonuclease-like protein